MIIPDINLLVYAYNERAPEHSKARYWWESCLNGTVPIGLSWVVISGYVRLMTHPRVLKNPMDVSAAIVHVREWLEQPPVRIIHEGTKFSDVFFDYILTLGSGGNLVTDVHLAALAVEYQAELHSVDADFSRFPGLRWRNPLKKLEEE